MGGAIAILLLLPFLNRNKTVSNVVNPVFKVINYLFFTVFLLLAWLGAQPVEQPYIALAQLCTTIYFLYFAIIYFITSPKFTKVFLFRNFVMRIFLRLYYYSYTNQTKLVTSFVLDYKYIYIKANKNVFYLFYIILLLLYLKMIFPLNFIISL